VASGGGGPGRHPRPPEVPRMRPAPHRPFPSVLRVHVHRLPRTHFPHNSPSPPTIVPMPNFSVQRRVLVNRPVSPGTCGSTGATLPTPLVVPRTDRILQIFSPALRAFSSLCLWANLGNIPAPRVAPVSPPFLLLPVLSPGRPSVPPVTRLPQQDSPLASPHSSDPPSPPPPPLCVPTTPPSSQYIDPAIDLPASPPPPPSCACV